MSKHLVLSTTELGVVNNLAAITRSTFPCNGLRSPLRPLNRLGSAAVAARCGEVDTVGASRESKGPDQRVSCRGVRPSSASPARPSRASPSMGQATTSVTPLLPCQRSELAFGVKVFLDIQRLELTVEAVDKGLLALPPPLSFRWSSPVP
jgi:hypothetical protein